MSSSRRALGASPAVRLVVAGHGPDAERRGEPSEIREQVALGLAVPLEKIAEQHHDVGPQRLDLRHSRREPALAQQTAEVEV